MIREFFIVLENLLEPDARLPKVASDPPEGVQRPKQLGNIVPSLSCERCSAVARPRHIRQLGAPSIGPGWSYEFPFDSACHIETEQRVPFLVLIEQRALLKLVPRVLTNRRSMVNQARDARSCSITRLPSTSAVSDSRASLASPLVHPLDSFEAESSAEDAEPEEKRLLVGIEKLRTPLDGRAERALPLGTVAIPVDKKGKHPVEPL